MIVKFLEKTIETGNETARAQLLSLEEAKAFSSEIYRIYWEGMEYPCIRDGQDFVHSHLQDRGPWGLTEKGEVYRKEGSQCPV